MENVERVYWIVIDWNGPVLQSVGVIKRTTKRLYLADRVSYFWYAPYVRTRDFEELAESPKAAWATFHRRCLREHADLAAQADRMDALITVSLQEMNKAEVSE